MNKIKHTLRLAKKCTYANRMTEGAKELLRNAIEEALKECENCSDNKSFNLKSFLGNPTYIFWRDFILALLGLAILTTILSILQ